MARPALASCPVLARALRDRSGAVAIEWTAIALAFAALLLASVELGRYYFMAQSLRSLVGDVARNAVVDTSLGRGGQDCTTPKTRFASRTPMINTASLSICVQRTALAGNQVQIDITGSHPFTFTTPLLSGLRFPALSETTRYTIPGT